MNIKGQGFIIGLLLTLLAGCNGQLPDWIKSDELVLKPEELIDIPMEYIPNVLWSKKIGEGSKNEYATIHPLLVGDAVITTDYLGQVYSTKQASGERNWKIALDEAIATGAGTNGEQIYIGTQKGGLIALDVKTGKFLWRRQVSSEILTPPQANMDTVVVRTADGKISAFSAKMGEGKWYYNRSIPLLSIRGDSTVVITGNTVIAGYANGRLVALSLDNGKILWEKTISLPRGRTEVERLVDIDAPPVIRNSLIYVVAYQGHLSVLDIDTGRQLWSRELSSKSGLDVADDGTVYITDDQSYVWAIQADTGNGLWRQKSLLRRRVTAPAIANDAIVVSDFEGYTHWLSKKDGRFIARQKIADEAITSQAVIDQSQMFILSQDGQLTAIAIPQ